MAYNANSSASFSRKLKWAAVPAALLALSGCTPGTSAASAPEGPAAIPAASAPATTKPTPEAPTVIKPFSELQKISKTNTIFVRPMAGFGAAELEGGFEGIVTCSYNDAVAKDRQGNVWYQEDNSTLCYGENPAVKPAETAAVVELVGGQQAPDTL